MYFDEKPEFLNSEIVGSTKSNLEYKLKNIEKFKKYLRGKVLDIGCCDGRWSAWALDNGAKFVHGIDKEISYINKSNEIFSKYFDKSNYKFEAINWKNFKSTKKYDLIFLFGILYYNDQEKLIETCSSLSDTILVDTVYSQEKRESFLTEDHIGQDRVMITLSNEELFKLFENYNYKIEIISCNERIFFVANR
jgi:2-polyprenyl-3-methyl-5-hydroxy-6-metoxy-1,4-benzoquinol methylase